MTPPAATQTTKFEPSSRMFRATICVQTRVGAVRLQFLVSGTIEGVCCGTWNPPWLLCRT
jgi:hypothetical protein